MNVPTSLWKPQRKELLAELFHALNQPLTSLACSLELALLTPQTPEQSEQTVREAAQRVEQVSLLTGCLQRLVQADDAGNQSGEVDVKKVLLEVVEELAPVAESLHVNLSFALDCECRLWCDASRLRQALFQLLECVLASATQEVRVELRLSREGAVMLKVTTLLKDASAEKTCGPQELSRRVTVAAAYLMLERAGATLDVLQDGNHLGIRVHLPEATVLADIATRRPTTFSASDG